MRKSLSKMAAAGIGAALIGLTLPSESAGDEKTVDFSGGVDVVSDYVWRGQLLTDDPVIQPYFGIGAKGFSLSVWGSVDTTDYNESGGEEFRFQEVDYSLSYSLSPAEGLDLTTGVIYYDFPGTGAAATSETFVSAALSDLPLTPTATVYYDFDEVNGIYADLGIGHTFSLTEKLGFNLSAGTGWADEDYNAAYFSVTESGFNDIGLKGALEYTVNDNCSISAYVKYSELLDSAVENAVADSDILSVGAGIRLSY